MTTIMYDHLDEYEEPIPQKASQAIREAVLSIHESLREAQEQERRASAARNRIITFRMPIDLLARLDAVTDDAATSRGHMLRQIVAEYMCYVEECDIRYNGSLLTAHAAKRHK
jgi:hypothetical protein